MKSWQQHQRDVQELSLGRGRFVLERAKTQSNLTREKDYFHNRLNINDLDKIITIDQKNFTATVEPRVTYETLVKETLKVGLVPLVVPEFKGITVGGAIMGASLESSSHLFGQVSDTMLSYQVLLGNGSIVTASLEENSDLFYGLSGSYGTLGVLLACTMRLEPASAFVQVTYKHLSGYGLLQKELQTIAEQENPPDYMESIIYSPAHAVLITGKKWFHLNKKPRYSLFPWKKWFYKHAETARDEEYLSLEDYLFRHDRGAFWMGQYLSDPFWLWKYFFHRHLKPLDFHYNPLFNRLVPFFFGSLFSSQRLYKTLHSLPEGWFRKAFVVQDFYMPQETVLEFLKHVTIFPIWLCPIRPTHTPQLLSPHALSTPLLFDVGVYGFAHNAIETTHYLEKLCSTLGGRKMLYSENFYSQEEFWKLYSKDDYMALRRRFYSEERFPSIEEKLNFQLP